MEMKNKIQALIVCLNINNTKYNFKITSLTTNEKYSEKLNILINKNSVQISKDHMNQS